MRFKCCGHLPPTASKPNEKRLFAYCGCELESGCVLIFAGGKVDKYRIEWDAGERCWLVCKDDPDAEIYGATPFACCCWGWRRWQKCRHVDVLTKLVGEWWSKKKDSTS